MSHPATTPRARLVVCLAIAASAIAHVCTAAEVPGPRLPLSFVADPSDTEFKFQIDLSLPVLVSPTGQSLLYGSYVQRSRWNLNSDDPPFRVQTNFSPEVGLALGPDLGRHLSSAWPAGLALSFAFVHESNGTEGELSRGWNRAMAVLHLGAPDAPLRASLCAWHPFRVEDTNPDLHRYAGDGEARILAELPVGDHNPFAGSTLRLRSAFSGDAPHGRFFTNLEAGLYLRPGFLPSWMAPGSDGPAVDVVAEWFVGYGQFLFGYDESVNRIRLGISLRFPTTVSP